MSPIGIYNRVKCLPAARFYGSRYLFHIIYTQRQADGVIHRVTHFYTVYFCNLGTFSDLNCGLACVK